MSKDKHGHDKDHHGHHDHDSHGEHHWQPGKKKMIHHDWRFWAAVVLMLLAIAAYVLSFNESLRPWGGPEKPEVPAAGG